MTGLDWPSPPLDASLHALAFRSFLDCTVAVCENVTWKGEHVRWARLRPEDAEVVVAEFLDAPIGGDSLQLKLVISCGECACGHIE